MRAQAPPNEGSYDPDISPDGNYVAFASDFSNPPTADNDGNFNPDIFRWDRRTPADAPEMVTLNDPSSEFVVQFASTATVGNNGNVAFQATNFAVSTTLGLLSFPPGPGDTANVYVRMFAAEADPTVTPPEYSQPDVVLGSQESDDFDPAISGDGNHLVYIARDDGPSGVPVREELAHYSVADRTTARIVPRPVGTLFPAGPSASFDGNLVAYRADVPAGEGVVGQVLVTDLAGATELISQAGGLPGDQPSDQPSLSSDGRYVAYRTTAANILRLDGDESVSETQVVVRDRMNPAAENELVSFGGASAQPPGSFPTIAGLGDDRSFAPAVTSEPDLTATGPGVPFVAFGSMASNLEPTDVEDDDLSDEDVFVRSFTSAELLTSTVPFDFGNVAIGSVRTRFVDFQANPFGFGPVSAQRVFLDPLPIEFSLGLLECPAVQPGQVCQVLARFRAIELGVRRNPLFVEWDSNPRIVDPDELEEPPIASRDLVAVGAPGVSCSSRRRSHSGPSRSESTPPRPRSTCSSAVNRTTKVVRSRSPRSS